MPRLYDTTRWRKERVIFLAANPDCVKCAKRGKKAKAIAVDHIIKHDDDKELFFDQTNWQGLCVSCHSEKTAQRDGGFGNKIKERHDPEKTIGCDMRGIPLDKNHHWNRNR